MNRYFLAISSLSFAIGFVAARPWTHREVPSHVSFNSVEHLNLALRKWAVGKGELEFHSTLTAGQGPIMPAMNLWTISVASIPHKLEIMLADQNSRDAHKFLTATGGVWVSVISPPEVVRKYLDLWKEHSVETWFNEWQKTEAKLQEYEEWSDEVPAK